MKRFREAGTAAREPLAIKQDADIFSLFFAEPITENYAVNGAMVVTVRGPLDHHDCGYGESYEGLLARFRAALDSEAPAVILDIDSPGGVVSGLNQCVYDMRRAKVAMGKPVYAYVGEMMCSAAYAVGSIADEICIPPSGIAGSIGVISLMYDQVGLDKAMGLNFKTITSGVRKADGHPHTEITDQAVTVEQARVDKLAAQFFRIVEKGRPISADQAKGYQAAIFLGKDAVKAGIADDVLGWEDIKSAVAAAHGTGVPKKSVAQSGTAAAHYVVTQPGARGARGNMLKIEALIAQTKKALVAEGDEKKRTKLAANLAAYEATLQATKKTKIKYEEQTEESGEEEEEEESSEESEEGGNETDREEGDDDDSKDDDKPVKKPDAVAAADDDGDDDDDDEESAAAEDSEEEASIAALRTLAAKQGGKALAAFDNLLAQRMASKVLSKRIAKIERRQVRDDRSAKVDAALSARRITKAEAKELRTKPLAFVTDYLSMRSKAIVRGPQDPLLHGQPDGTIDNGYPDAQGAGAHFSKEETAENERMIADIVARSGGKVTREMVIKDFNARLATLNGAPKGRY